MQTQYTNLYISPHIYSYLVWDHGLGVVGNIPDIEASFLTGAVLKPSA